MKRRRARTAAPSLTVLTETGPDPFASVFGAQRGEPSALRGEQLRERIRSTPDEELLACLPQLQHLPVYPFASGSRVADVHVLMQLDYNHVNPNTAQRRLRRRRALKRTVYLCVGWWDNTPSFIVAYNNHHNQYAAYQHNGHSLDNALDAVDRLLALSDHKRKNWSREHVCETLLTAAGRDLR